MIDMPNGYYEHIYITKHYSCGHTMLQAVRRDSATKRQNEGKDRVVFVTWPERCPNCQDLVNSRTLSQMPQVNDQVHYMVDGYPMTINQYSGYWRGRRWDHGKFVNKYFGKADPRPLLEEAP